ncbi:hypothetical protein [Streptosporangium sp. NPDC004631]
MLPVACRGRGRVSIAALICAKPGMRTRLIYRMRTYHQRRHKPRGFTVADFQALLQAAHTQLGGPISLVQAACPSTSAPRRARGSPSARTGYWSTVPGVCA